MSAPVVLAIGAHPDDIEIGCGGTLARLRAAGARLVFVIVTDGAEGSAAIAREELVRIREEEARAGARRLGAEEVRFLGQKEAAPFDPDLKPRLISLLRRVRPSAVFTHASCETMGDHRRVHELTVDAVTLAGGPWYRDCGPPHAVPALYGYEVWAPLPAPGLTVGIADTLEEKSAALACHASQLRDIDYGEAVRGLARYRGAMQGKAGAAEAFEILRLTEMPGLDKVAAL